MQKVVTITTHTNIINAAQTKVNYVATQYPEIDELLNEGYKVLQIVPVSDTAENSFRYSLTFLLEKTEKTKTPRVFV